MAYPSKVEQRRKDFMPKVAAAFIDLGYRGTTSAQLARRCGVRQNVLYRIWPSKKAMFLAAVEWVYVATMNAWEQVAAGPGEATTVAERLLAHQAKDHGRMRLYRIVFAGLAANDTEIKSALRDVYRRFHQFIVATVSEHRARRHRRGSLEADQAAWALIGLGAAVDIQRELQILPRSRRGPLMRDIGLVVLNGTPR